MSPKIKILLWGLWLLVGYWGGTAVAQAQPVGYLGNGYFATNQINWCHAGSYATANNNAAANWSAAADLDIYGNCTNSQITTSTVNWGNNGLYGKAYICMKEWWWFSQSCDDGAFNNTFVSCVAYSNSYYLASWTSTERQFNAMHELGHCWSLSHNSESSSVMKTGRHTTTWPNSTDISRVNNRY